MTKEEIIAELKNQYPTLKSGSDETGYTDLSAKDYQATIEQWADAQITMQEKAALETAAEANKTNAQAKLEALGLTAEDLKALGL